MSFLWWRRILMTENGLIVRNNFVPWEHCQRWYWDACNKDVAVIATSKSIAMRIPDSERDKIEALLDTHIAMLRIRKNSKPARD
jgi:hypothetical protein